MSAPWTMTYLRYVKPFMHPEVHTCSVLSPRVIFLPFLYVQGSVHRPFSMDHRGVPDADVRWDQLGRSRQCQRSKFGGCPTKTWEKSMEKLMFSTDLGSVHISILCIYYLGWILTSFFLFLQFWYGLIKIFIKYSTSLTLYIHLNICVVFATREFANSSFRVIVVNPAGRSGFSVCSE